MGATPQGKDITIEFECQFRIDLQNSDFPSLRQQAIYHPDVARHGAEEEGS